MLSFKVVFVLNLLQFIIGVDDFFQESNFINLSGEEFLGFNKEKIISNSSVNDTNATIILIKKDKAKHEQGKQFSVSMSLPLEGYEVVSTKLKSVEINNKTEEGKIFFWEDHPTKVVDYISESKDKNGYLQIEYPLHFHDNIQELNEKEENLISIWGTHLLAYSKLGYGIKIYTIKNNFMRAVELLLRNQRPVLVIPSTIQDSNDLTLLIQTDKETFLTNLTIANDTVSVSEHKMIIGKNLISNTTKLENYYFRFNRHYISFKDKAVIVFNNAGEIITTLGSYVSHDKTFKEVQIHKTIFTGKSIYILSHTGGILKCRAENFTDGEDCYSLIYHNFIQSFDIDSDRIYLLQRNSINETNLVFLEYELNEPNNCQKGVSLNYPIFNAYYSQVSGNYIYFLDNMLKHLLVFPTNTKTSVHSSAYIFNSYAGYAGNHDFVSIIPSYSSKKTEISLSLNSSNILTIEKAEVATPRLNFYFSKVGVYKVKLEHVFRDKEGKYKKIYSESLLEITEKQEKFLVSIETLFIIVFIMITIVVIVRRLYGFGKSLNTIENINRGYTPTFTTDRNMTVFDESA